MPLCGPDRHRQTPRNTVGSSGVSLGAAPDAPLKGRCSSVIHRPFGNAAVPVVGMAPRSRTAPLLRCRSHKARRRDSGTGRQRGPAGSERASHPSYLVGNTLLSAVAAHRPTSAGQVRAWFRRRYGHREVHRGAGGAHGACTGHGRNRPGLRAGIYNRADRSAERPEPVPGRTLSERNHRVSRRPGGYA
jgi:hypothetical protein